jgi:cbb3-type cytochrome oxidase maturation protein
MSIIPHRRASAQLCKQEKPEPMSALFLLIGISLVVAGSFLGAFLWATRSGQYEDDYGPAVRILFDDKPANKQTTSK